jgi:molecular chaperone Hsp33
MAAAQTDRVVRAITDDNSFRVITLRSTDTVRGVINAQKATDRTAIRCGELVSGAVLVRETMAPDRRVQAIMMGGNNSGSLVADAHPDGSTRGLVNKAKQAPEVTIGDGAMLQVVRTMYRGEIQQGVVEVGEHGLSGALTSYMMGSEQVYSVIQVACVLDERGAVVAAGGYIVQMLPEVNAESLSKLTGHLEQLRPVAEALLESDADPEALLREVLSGMPFTRVNESPIHFGCYCDLTRVVSALATLGRDEIRQLIASEEILDVGCDYCGKRYQIGPSQLRPLLEES